ncbi:hypothetical protein MTP99_019244 [Tenebrio molitor]|jgi:carbonic anhydrase|nr:hypothetical protein MTP99_019244 [Tenebrio molitor]CAH1377840.1 unnamed protein product [Tenebrio molitor]
MITTSVLSLVIILIFSNSGGTFAADWSYKNEETWPAECIKGKEQSPIALSESAAEEKSFPEFVFEQYDDRYMAKIKNNGHAVEIRIDGNVRPTVRGGGLPSMYILDNLHLHWKSEHTINDERFPLELHLVHYSNNSRNVAEGLKHKGGVAVIAVLFYFSPDDDDELDHVFDAVDRLHKQKINEFQQIGKIDLNDFLPRDRAGFYRYNGSLTTPGCTEGVIWTVFTNPLPVSQSQVKSFSMLRTHENNFLSANFRNLQDLNDREVYLKISRPLNSGTFNSAFGSFKIFMIFIALFKIML